MKVSLPESLKDFVDEQVTRGGYGTSRRRTTRYAHELNLPGLRFWPLARHPHLVFYIERDNHVDVWRVLHGQRDIPAWMHDI